MAFGLPCSGQFRGHNLSEYHKGKLPSDKASFETIYNRLFTTYRYKKFTAKGTFELFQLTEVINLKSPLAQLAYRKI